MRRVLLLALLFVVCMSCFYRPAFVDGRPIAQSGIGSPPPKAAQMRGAGSGMQVCREISRSRCDAAQCKGKNLDLVTLSCSGAQVSRCELGKGGC